MATGTSLGGTGIVVPHLLHLTFVGRLGLGFAGSGGFSAGGVGAGLGTGGAGGSSS